MIIRSLVQAVTLFAVAAVTSSAQQAPAFEPVPALSYRVVDGFFQLPTETNFGEVSGVAINSEGHIFVFQRAKPMLVGWESHQPKQ